MMERIRCGVIGLGWFGEHHVDALKALPLAEVRGVCTRREDRLKEVATKYDIPKSYTNYHDLLANKEIDVISVVTHVKDHLQITIDALQAGKHVFLEKPMADNTEECDQIIREAEKTDKNFMVGHICRFGADYVIAKEEIEGGKIGEILSIHLPRSSCWAAVMSSASTYSTPPARSSSLAPPVPASLLSVLPVAASRTETGRP